MSEQASLHGTLPTPTNVILHLGSQTTSQLTSSQEEYSSLRTIASMNLLREYFYFRGGNIVKWHSK